MLGRFDRLKPDKGDLHGAKETDDEKGVVSNVDPLRISVHQQQDKDVQGNQIDDEDVATPSRYLSEIHEYTSYSSKSERKRNIF